MIDRNIDADEGMMLDTSAASNATQVSFAALCAALRQLLDGLDHLLCEGNPILVLFK